MVGRCSLRNGFAGHLTREEREDLAALFVRAQRPECCGEASRLEMCQICLDRCSERTCRPANCVTDSDDAWGDTVTDQRSLDLAVGVRRRGGTCSHDDTSTGS